MLVNKSSNGLKVVMHEILYTVPIVWLMGVFFYQCLHLWSWPVMLDLSELILPSYSVGFS